jgi:hypothetical protein
MTYDMFVYFYERPEGLEGFLEEQGYEPDPDSSNERIIVYDNLENGWPRLFYEPVYDKGGKDAKSLLDINFHDDDLDATKEAIRLGDELVKRYNARIVEENEDLFNFNNVRNIDENDLFEDN